MQHHIKTSWSMIFRWDFILRIKGLRNATTFHYDFPPSAKDFILRIKGLRNATFVSGIPRQENLFISYSE